MFKNNRGFLNVIIYAYAFALVLFIFGQIDERNQTKYVAIVILIIATIALGLYLGLKKLEFAKLVKLHDSLLADENYDANKGFKKKVFFKESQMVRVLLVTYENLLKNDLETAYDALDKLTYFKIAPSVNVYLMKILIFKLLLSKKIDKVDEIGVIEKYYNNNKARINGNKKNSEIIHDQKIIIEKLLEHKNLAAARILRKNEYYKFDLVKEFVKKETK